MDREWAPSETTEARLLDLVVQGVLPEKERAGWRAPDPVETYPMPLDDEAVVFEDYFTRGFGFPISEFVHKLLTLWCVSLCNLPPNTIFHLSLFIYLCECWVGIPADMDLFNFLFRLCHNNRGTSRIVGACYLSLRDGRKDLYPEIPFVSNVGPWHKR